jgi:hypothetical protein
LLKKFLAAILKTYIPAIREYIKMTNPTLVTRPQHLTSTNKRALKEEKLIKLANSVLDSAQYKTHFEQLLNKLQLTRQVVIKGFLDYNLDIFSPEGNEIYLSPENRVVLHLHNLIEGSWHIERQQVIWDFLQKTSAKRIADIGFGVPSLYVKNILSEDNAMSIALCDHYPTAFEFAKTLISLWSDNWVNKISFIKTDMDALDFIGPFDLYIFQDSIEHTLEPTAYLKKYVDLSPANSFFLISLPLGPIIPRHYIAWETNEEAQAWLNDCGLQVIFQRNVYVNLAVDLFAEELGDNFNDYYVLCRKM